MNFGRGLFKSLALVVLMLMTSVLARAQVKVDGTVVDETGEVVIGASVVLKGNPGTGTVSDFDGNFSLSVPSAQSVLVVSYVGMVSQEIKIGSQRHFKIVLKDDKQVLQDVVVVGYGQQKKASVVGAITQTDAKVLERTGGVSSLGAALTGNLPAVITM